MNVIDKITAKQIRTDIPEFRVGDTVKVGVRIIGFKNVTDHAGATSLIYMMKSALSSRYNVACIEVNKKDFMYFNDESMVSINANELGNTVLKYKDADLIQLILGVAAGEYDEAHLLAWLQHHIE